jgi:uncharacterized radical SAM superfamily Fe-S cluster-containing enzyme
MDAVHTTTLCPSCLRRLEGTLVRRGDEVWLWRDCPDHGVTEALVWRGPPDHDAWRAGVSGSSAGDPAENPACPAECGLCAGHARQTCCVLLEVTERCNLACPVCFAAAGEDAPADPSIETVEGWYRRLLEVAPGCNVQLSGGEPTMRDDLPEVVALGRALGHGFVQLNTNGLRLARERGYAERLAAAGLSTVFLQFDGVDDEPYVALRGRPLAAVKDEAVRRCARAGLGVVLVPTVVRGVNLDRLGSILDYALAHAPAVRGVHVQPMALLGRNPTSGSDLGAERLTLPDAMRALAGQSGGRVLLEDLTPGDCEHAVCSFSREYLRRDDGSLAPFGAPRDACGCGAPASRPRESVAPADKAAHVAARWTAPAAPSTAPASPATAPDALSVAGCCSGPPEGGPPSPAPDPWGAIIADIHAGAFSISGMAFMDAWTIDLDRLRRCYLHVLARDGRVVPFCAYNLTSVTGGLPGGRQTAGASIGERETPGEGRRRLRDCMVCGADLRYHETEQAQTCHYCGADALANACCEAGHHVCDACHGATAVQVLERVCLRSRETDAVALMQAVRGHPAFPIHGPEHHSLVPAVILAALRNGGAPVSDEQIVASVRRGETVTGGACAYLGVCGAASGVGIAISLLLGTDPLDGRGRQAVQRATASVLRAVASYQAPRCCQRDAWTAIREASLLLPEVAGLQLESSHDLVCGQWGENAECIHADCPLWPAPAGSARRAGAVARALGPAAVTRP